MKISLSIIAVVIYFLLPFVSPLAAEKHVDNEKPTVRIGVFPLEPLNFLDSNNEAIGVYPDLIREIGRQEFWAMEFIPGSWADCMENLQAGRIDLITTVAYSEDRATTIDYNQVPVIDIWGQVYIRPGDKISNILDLSGKRVAIARRDINGVNFLKTVEQFKVVPEIIEMSTHEDILEGIRIKKIDAGVVPQHFGLRHAKDYDVVGTSIIFSPFSVYFGVKKGQNQQLLDKIDIHLTNWKSEKNSFYYQRLNYWMGGNQFTKEIIPKWLLIFLGVVLIGSIISICFIYTLKKTVAVKTKELLDTNTDLRKKTEQLKLHEQELSRKHAEFLAIYNSITDAIVFVDLERRILMVNPAFETILGYKQNELIGKTTQLFYADPDDYHRQGKTRFHNNANVSSPIYEIGYRRKDGTVFQSETLGVPVRNQHGENIGFLSVIRDITDRIESDKEKDNLREQYQQAQKMEAIGTLAGGIAHDFNNILTAIIGYGEMVSDELKAGSTILDNQQEVIKAGLRAKDLVKQILSFGRKAEIEKKPVQMDLIIKDALKMLSATIPKTIEIRQDIEDCGVVFADPSQLHQILMNLCTNAYQAMPAQEGVLGISLQIVSIESGDRMGATPYLAPGKYAKLEVSDTGNGIEKELLDKIFDPYFTTKGKEKGTGLGLSVVHGLVKSMSGYVTVYSERNRGTTVCVFIPISDTETSEEPRFDKMPDPIGNEKILLLDDEKAIVEMEKQMLESLGYHIYAYSSPADALDSFHDNPEKFDIVITDMTMPGMTGADFIKKIRVVRSNIPIILCSGFSELIDKDKAIALSINKYLSKPISKHELAKAVREVLDG